MGQDYFRRYRDATAGTSNISTPLNRSFSPFNGIATIATTFVLLIPSLVTITVAYSPGWMHGSSRQAMSHRTRGCISNTRPIFEKSAASGRLLVPVPLFSSPTDDDDARETTKSESATVPDISATQADIDFMSVHEIDWAEMDPLNQIPFDDYEELYLHGKAKDDESSTKSNSNCDASYDSIMTGWDDSVPTLNHISLVGRVGNPPEARYFDNPLGGSGGNSNSNKPNVVVSMSLALPRYYSAWEREQYGIEYGQEETDWYNLEVWGYLAEFAMKNVQKGSRIGVVGSIDTDYYRNKNSDLLSTNPKVLVQDLDILESKAESDARRMSNNDGGRNNYGGGGGKYNSNQYYGSNNNYGNRQQGEQERGPSFFTDDDDDDDALYDPTRGSGAGGFFDTV